MDKATKNRVRTLLNHLKAVPFNTKLDITWGITDSPVAMTPGGSTAVATYRLPRGDNFLELVINHLSNVFAKIEKEIPDASSVSVYLYWYDDSASMPVIRYALRARCSQPTSVET